MEITVFNKKTGYGVGCNTNEVTQQEFLKELETGIKNTVGYLLMVDGKKASYSTLPFLKLAINIIYGGKN